MTDETGKQFEPTYLKRAKGLVKHGRARWTGEETICLTCPPEQIETEDDEMDDMTAKVIREQIEFLKADLNREVPLNMDSEFQPEAACKIELAREATKRQILELMDRLAGREPPRQDERQYYRQMLERIAGDKAALEVAKDAAEEMDDDDTRLQVINNAVDEYEQTKREIAEKLFAKLN